MFTSDNFLPSKLDDLIDNRYDSSDPDVILYGFMLDIAGYRVVRCRSCGRIVRVSECWTYGGLGDLINTGICYNCK